ncbi:MAG: hypothetical protein HRT61_04900 [Ekhidna sp.]|nr:hypothetical protein [Ekhidna sp.]
MRFFYIRHHFQSILRNPSFDGEVLAFALLALIFGSFAVLNYPEIDAYAKSIGLVFKDSESSHSLFLVLYVFLDLLLRIVFKRPNPKLKYYLLWYPPSSELSMQYLFTSLFGIIPLALFTTLIAIVLKAYEWFDWQVALSIALIWLANHFTGLVVQFGSRVWRVAIASFLCSLVFFEYYGSMAFLAKIQMNPWFSISVVLIAALLAHRAVKSYVEARNYEIREAKDLMDYLPVISFKNPFFQLEWSLLIRNKRTRSNLIFGIIALILLPIYNDMLASVDVFVLYGLLVSGFFLLQHGIYSYGWEGAFFDFLLSGTDMKKFLHARWNFYSMISIAGTLLLATVAFFKGISITYVMSALLFNIGVTIPIVLYRSSFHDTKIDLTDSILANYQGMITGPILVSSILIIIVPIVIYGVVGVWFDSSQPLCLGVVGIVGWLFKEPIIAAINRSLQKRKYHLSQSFKS